MKTFAKILSFIVPIKKYRKKFLNFLENILWCSEYRNIYIWKIRKTAQSVGKDLKVFSSSKVNTKTVLGDNVALLGLKVTGKGKLTIGSNVVIAGDCMIVTESHNYEGETIPYDRTYMTKDTEIGDCVWIGTRVLILPGTKIGEGAIIQGGSVVHGEIPPCAIAGGNPAKVFKYRNIEHFNKLKNEKKFFLH